MISRVLAFATVAIAAWVAASSCARTRDVERASDLIWPVQLAATHFYRDGGTVSFTLVGAGGETLKGGSDGRMQAGSSPRLYHCYVGGEYPSRPGARLVPLWGPEERDLAALKVTAPFRADSVSVDRLQGRQVRAALTDFLHSRVKKIPEADAGE